MQKFKAKIAFKPDVTMFKHRKKNSILQIKLLHVYLLSFYNIKKSNLLLCVV